MPTLHVRRASKFAGAARRLPISVDGVAVGRVSVLRPLIVPVSVGTHLIGARLGRHSAEALSVELHDDDAHHVWVDFAPSRDVLDGGHAILLSSDVRPARRYILAQELFPFRTVWPGVAMLVVALIIPGARLSAALAHGDRFRPNWVGIGFSAFLVVVATWQISQAIRFQRSRGR